MNIVIDTNVVASALFFGGKPQQVLEAILSGKAEAFASVEILEEYYDTVDSLASMYPGKAHAPIHQIAAAMNVITPTTTVKASRDPDDDKFISCAIDSHSVYIVSGDKDLLTIGRYADIEIVTAAEFLARLR